MPLPAEDESASVTKTTNTQVDEADSHKNHHHHHQTLPNNTQFKGTTKSSQNENFSTIEISGVVHQRVIVNTNNVNREEQEQEQELSNEVTDGPLINSNEDTTTKNGELLDETAASVEQQNLLYCDKKIEIDRPLNYAQRGFGFLLNTGLSVNGSSTAGVNLVLKNGDIETTVINDSYAQVVVVEPGNFFFLIYIL